MFCCVRHVVDLIMFWNVVRGLCIHDDHVCPPQWRSGWYIAIVEVPGSSPGATVRCRLGCDILTTILLLWILFDTKKVIAKIAIFLVK